MELPPDNQEHQNPFETRADEYDHWFVTHHSLFLKQQNLIRPYIRNTEGMILEIGCGPGRFASGLLIPFGIEPSRPMCRLAYMQGISITQGIGEFLPYRSRSIAQVVLIAVLGFLTRPTCVLQEIQRCIIPSGSLIVVDIDLESKTGQRYLKKQISSTFISRAYLYSQQEIITLLHNNGFIVSSFKRSADLILITGVSDPHYQCTTSPPPGEHVQS
ncbi:MAG TPA: methyltransferase domain-containing protein [Methanospirillum sp.]|nr:methyltransferase domain-containing protein [Methanospirillum sp.]